MKAPKKRNGSTALFITAIVLILAVFALLNSRKTQHQKAPVIIPQLIQNVPYTRPEMDKMMVALFADMGPDKPENSYMPLFAREKFRQILRENNQGMLGLKMEESKQIFPDGDANIVTSDYDETGKPTIHLDAQRLANLALLDFRLGLKFSRLLKNNMYYGIVHERLHLDQEPDVLLHRQTFGQHIEEEMRVWAICDKEIVTPLLLEGEPMDGSLLKANTALKSCKVGWENCLAFRQFIVAGKIE
jgi:hypothetical protein